MVCIYLIIDNPTFLIEINSLLDIKFLNKKAIEIIITKGIVSDIIVGILNNDNKKKVVKLIFHEQLTRYF